MDSAGKDGGGGDGRADRGVRRWPAADRRPCRVGAYGGRARGCWWSGARELLEDPGQGEFVLGLAPAAPRVAMIGPPGAAALFDEPGSATGERGPVAPPRVVGTSSRVLYDALSAVFTDLGFDALGDAVFRDLVIARIVEPTSILDTGRVLSDLGVRPASEKTMRRTLARAAAGEGPGAYRDKVAELCFTHAATSGDVSLCLYDVTTLYFEAEKEDDLRKVGYSKERRVDPQIVVGLLVDRHGFPLEIGCDEGNQEIGRAHV